MKKNKTQESYRRIITFSPEQYDKIKALAEKEDRSFAYFVRLAIDKFFKNYVE